MSCQIFDEPGRDAATIEEIMVWTADHGAVISQNSWTYVPGLPDLSQSGKAAIDYFIKYAGCDENGNQTGPMKGGIVILPRATTAFPTRCSREPTRKWWP